MKKIKICFLGLGSIALKHLKNLKKFSIKNSIKIELYALRQSKFNLLYDFSEFDIKYMYSYEEFKENNYDVVFITNPTNLHYVSLINTINHTKFVFLEKPSFDNSSYDFSSLEPKSNFIYVACPLRFHNLIRHAREIISSEKVFSCRIICSSYMPDWQKSRDYRDSFRSDANKGGGVDIDLIHEIDYMTFLFGFPKSVQKTVKKVSNLEINSSDLACFIFDYGNLVSEVHLDYFGRFPTRKLEIFTSNNTYVFDLLNFVVTKNGINQNFLVNDFYYEELENFFNIIEKNTSNINSLIYSVNVLKLIK